MFTGLPTTGSFDGNDRTSQVPGGPLYERALLSDPGGTSALGHYRASMLPSAQRTASAPTTMLISGLNHTARPFAVYASQSGLLHRHARLASGWLANLSGRGWLPAGSQRKVSDHLILLSQASPGAPFAELKGEFALDVVPTNHYGANSAWLQLSILAHNLTRSFQLHSTLATPKPRSRKRTYSYRIASMKTLRFLLINRAARLARISGRNVLRFSSNAATEELYDRVADHLAAA